MRYSNLTTDETVELGFALEARLAELHQRERHLKTSQDFRNHANHLLDCLAIVKKTHTEEWATPD